MCLHSRISLCCTLRYAMHWPHQLAAASESDVIVIVSILLCFSPHFNDLYNCKIFSNFLRSIRDSFVRYLILSFNRCFDGPSFSSPDSHAVHTSRTGGVCDFFCLTIDSDKHCIQNIWPHLVATSALSNDVSHRKQELPYSSITFKLQNNRSKGFISRFFLTNSSAALLRNLHQSTEIHRMNRFGPSLAC